MVAASAFGALVLGEYDFSGATPYVAGVLFGLAIAEVALTIGRDAGLPVALLSAALAMAGMAWGAWISSGRGVAPIPVGAWVGGALAGAAGFAWVRWSGRRERPSRVGDGSERSS